MTHSFILHLRVLSVPSHTYKCAHYTIFSAQGVVSRLRLDCITLPAIRPENQKHFIRSWKNEFFVIHGRK